VKICSEHTYVDRSVRKLAGTATNLLHLAPKCSSKGRECSKVAANSQNTLELRTEEWVSGWNRRSWNLLGSTPTWYKSTTLRHTVLHQNGVSWAVLANVLCKSGYYFFLSESTPKLQNTCPHDISGIGRNSPLSRWPLPWRQTHSLCTHDICFTESFFQNDGVALRLFI